MTHFDKILQGIASAHWASFRINYDCFTRKPVEEEDFVSTKLNASNNEFYHPGGWIHYSNKNSYYMDLANIVFRVKNDIFPVEFANIPPIFDIRRSKRIHEEQGRIQSAFTFTGDGIKIKTSKEDGLKHIYVMTRFPNSNSSIEIKDNNSIFIDGEKSYIDLLYYRYHLLSDIIKLNNLNKIKITFKSFSNDLIEEFEDNTLKETAIYVNNLQEDWIEHTFMPALNIDNIEEFVDIIIE